MNGKITESGLLISAEPRDGYKPIVCADIPEFNQCAQAVRQSEAIDRGDDIYMGVEVYDLPPQEESEISV